MKKHLLFIALIFTISSLRSYSQTPDEIVSKLLNEENWFELKTQREQLNDELSPVLNYLSKAMVSMAFNKPQKGIIALDSLLSNEEYQSQLGFGNICNLVMLKSKFYADKFKFREASDLLGEFIKNASKYFTEELSKNVQSQYDYYTSLAKLDKMSIYRPKKDCNLKCNILTKNNKSLLSVFCKVNEQNAEMIFDTGNPSFTLVSKAFAEKYGIRKIDAEIEVKGVGKESGWIGTTDSLNLGGIVCYNPIFYVVNSILPEKAVKEELVQFEAVLGSNILFEIGEFQYFPKENKIIFPSNKTPLPQCGHNLIMRNDKHQYIQTYINGKRRQMHLDSGSARTTMSNKFYSENKSWVIEKGKRDSTNYAGFGGISRQLIYTLPQLDITIGNKKHELKDVEVQTEQSHDIWEDIGTIGINFLSQYEKITVSYENMFIEIE